MYQTKSNPCLKFKLFVSILTFIILVNSGYPQVNKLDEKNLEQSMRNPWTADRADYLQDWLILGGFPITSIAELDNDFLAAYGGEKNMMPEEEQIIKFTDGTEIKWQRYQSSQKVIDLNEVFKGSRIEDVIAYAYTTINRKKTEKVLLAVGSDDGVKIWLNGKEVHRNLILRAVNLDEDLVEVELKAGDNHLLVKIHQAKGDWGFAVRIIDENAGIELISKTLKFSFSNIDPQNNLLTIATSKYMEYDLPQQNVNVQVYSTGGKTVMDKSFQFGEPITLNYKNWKDGVYEFRVGYNELNGLYRTNYLTWYKGDILKAATELVNSAPDGKANSPEDLTHRMLADLIFDRLEGNLENPDSSKYQSIHSPLMEYAELKAQKQIRPGGFVRLAYIDDIDGTPQFCRCYLPLNYDPAKKWPMVIFLHGYNGQNPEYIHWWAVDKRHDYIVDRYNFILIEPHGRGNTSYLGIGDRDVLTCIKMAQNKFNVDKDRIYLTGASMGGGGTWHVGSRHPQIFAALAPVYGGWDYHVWMNKERQNNLPEREKYLAEKSSSAAQFEALLNTPILVLHGDQDKAVDVNFSRYLVRMLQRWGYDVRYIEVPDKGHGDLGTNDLLYPWLLQHKRNNAPKKVRVRAAELRNASAWWVKVTQRQNPWEFILVDAEVLSNNLIRMDSRNAVEIILTPHKGLIDYSKPLKVVWNGRMISLDPATDKKVILRSEDYQPRELKKTPQLAGPINDFTNTPFAIVIGSISQDSLMQKLINQKADSLIADWNNWQKYEPRVFKDITMSEADIQNYSLHLVGGPRENRVSQMILEKMPFKIDTEEIHIEGKTFTAKDAVLDMIYPNPFNQQRYIRIVAATSAAGMYFYDHRREDLSDFDFYISDGKIPNSRAGFPEYKIRIATGNFDCNWQIDEAYLQEGDPELRAKCATNIINEDLSTSIIGAIKVPLNVLESYVGSYKVEQQGFEVNIMLTDDKLLGQGPNGSPVELHALTEKDFFIKEMDVQLSFQEDIETNENVLIIYDGNQELKGIKIE